MMRTNKLFLTALLGLAGVASSFAADVYSVNVVGYVNLNLPAGYSLVSNPLKAADDTLNTILPAAPDGAQVFRFDSTAGRFGSVYSFIEGAGWQPSNASLPMGEGAFIFLDSAATLTFVGEVAQGNLSTTVPVGYSILASQVPQAGKLSTDLKFAPVDGDQVFQFNSAAQAYSSTIPSYIEGAGWVPAEPTLAVGEGFFLFRDASLPGANWTRNFTVAN